MISQEKQRLHPLAQEEMLFQSNSKILITLCMKLSWFCHTNSRQLFCNCPLFVIALVPGLFFGGKPDQTCCHSVVASKWLETRVSHFALQDENTTT